MKLSKTNGKDMLVLNDPMFRVTMMKRGKNGVFLEILF